MAETRIDVPSGVFGNETYAFIQNDGRIEVPDGIGRRTVAVIQDGDVYVNDGFMHRTKVLEGDGKGSFYSTSDAGLLSKGSLAFKVGPNGDIRNGERDYVGKLNVNQEEFLKKHSAQGIGGAGVGGVSGSTGFGGGAIVIGVVLAAFFLLACTYVFWGNISPANISHQSILFVLLFVAACVLSTVLICRKKELMGFGEIALKAASIYLAGSFVYAVFAICEAAVKHSLTIPDILVAVLFTPVFMLGASLPLLFIQTGCFWASRKAAASKKD